MTVPVIYEGPDRYARKLIPQEPYTGTLDAIVAKYRVRTALDFGCGLGVDTALMLRKGLEAYGLDGSKALIPHLLFDSGRYWVVDLRDELTFGVDLVWCREVAEHIEPEHSETLVGNIVRSCRVCYFTAAPPGQVGSGHINCRPKGYWRDLFADHGFTVDEELTALNGANPDQDDRVNGMVLS